MPEIELGCKLSYGLHLRLYIQEPWSVIAWKVICTYSPLNNFQQGLICISDSKTTSIQVISTLLNVLQQCTSKYFANVGKYNYFRNTERREKRQVPSWLRIKPLWRRWAEVRSPCPKSGAPGCEAPFLLNKSPVPASSGCRIPLLGGSTDTQH